MSKLGKLISEKTKNIPTGVKASFFFVFCGALKDAIDFLTTPVFSRILTQEEYGMFNTYNSWYQIFRVLISLYMFGEGFNVGMSRFENDREGYTSSQQGLMTVLFLFWSGVYAINYSGWNTLLRMETALVILLLCQIMFTTSYNCWQQKKKYTYDYKRFVPVAITYTILQPVLGIVLIKLNDSMGGNYDNALIRIYTGVGIQILFGVIIYFTQFVRKPKFYQKEHWRFSLRTNGVLVPHYFSQILLNHSDRLMIDYFAGKAKTAIYSIAHSAAFTLFVVTSNLNSTFVPWLYAKMKKKDTEGIRKFTSFLIILVAITSLLLVLVTPELMMILGKSEYKEGTWIIPPLTFSVYLTFVYTLFADVELFYGKNSFVTCSAVLGAGSNIILNYLLIPVYGYFAAGYTTIVGYIIMCAGHYMFFRITCRKEKVAASEFFNIKLILLVSLLLAGMCGGIMALYEMIIPRYLILAAMMLAIYMKRDVIIRFYKDMRKSKAAPKAAATAEQE